LVLSADDFLMVGGKYVWSETRAQSAHARCHRAFLRALEAGTDLVIVDNTNTKWKQMRGYVKVSLAHGYKVTVVQVECDPKVAAARNSHGVPLAVVEKMAAEMAAFKVPEGRPVRVRRA
jgi:predicted kinase